MVMPAGINCGENKVLRNSAENSFYFQLTPFSERFKWLDDCPTDLETFSTECSDFLLDQDLADFLFSLHSQKHALVFSGNDNSYGQGPSLDPYSNDYTILGWIYPIASGYFFTIDLAFGLSAAGLWREYSGGSGTVSLSIPFPTNRWSFFAAVYSKPDYVVYINGVKTGETHDVAPYSGSRVMYIATYDATGGYSNEKIGALAIYERVFSYEEVLKAFFTGIPIEDALAFYVFEPHDDKLLSLKPGTDATLYNFTWE